MRQNQRGGINLQRFTHNFSRMDLYAADGTSKHLFMANNTMLVIQNTTKKSLVHGETVYFAEIFV